MDRHRAAYRALLVAYPVEYRRDYGEPMTQLFVDRLREDGGGARSFLLWVQMLIDLVKTAFTERLETTMQSFRTDWWRILALPLSLFVVFVGIGNMIEDTQGALYGRIGYAAATVVGLGLVIAGLIVRKRNRMVGSTMIAVGVMPAFPMTILFWFPPVALVGVLSIVISIMAFLDAPKAPQSLFEPAQ
jgi:hypothetical protein